MIKVGQILHKLSPPWMGPILIHSFHNIPGWHEAASSCIPAPNLEDLPRQYGCSGWPLYWWLLLNDASREWPIIDGSTDGHQWLFAGHRNMMKWCLMVFTISTQWLTISNIYRYIHMCKYIAIEWINTRFQFITNIILMAKHTSDGDSGCEIVDLWFSWWFLMISTIYVKWMFQSHGDSVAH